MLQHQLYQIKLSLTSYQHHVSKRNNQSLLYIQLQHMVYIMYLIKHTSVISNLHILTLLNIFVPLQLKFGLNQCPTQQPALC